MEELGGGSAFARRVGYLKYNFRQYLDEVSTSSKVLEIGPGTGELLQILKDKGVLAVDIIDNDPAILNYCKKKFKIRSTILSTSLDLSKSLKSKYDLIVLTQVFEHIPKSSYLNWIKNLYSSLNPGGNIIITVPNGANPLSGTERYGDLQHENIFTIFSFRELMTFADLKNSSYKIQGFEIPPNSPVNVIRIILQKILHIFFILIMMMNGAIYQTLMTPSITLIISKK
jgi:SAM-dependent methyltransferase